MLNAAEKRVLAEWIDTGGKYYNDPFDERRQRAHGERPEQGDFRARMSCRSCSTTCAASCHQAIGSSTSTCHRDVVPQQPLRAHRRCGRRLRRDADDGLRRLQPASNELPARSRRRCRIRRPGPTACRRRRAAGRQRQLQHDRELDRRRLLRMTLHRYPLAPPPQPGTVACAAALLDRAAREPCAACGGSSNPLGNPAPRSAIRKVSGNQRLSFAYFQRCINPIFVTQLQRATVARPPTPAPARGCHDTRPAPAALFASCRARRRST